MGPNGAGKSTLVKTLIGRVKPDEGEVRLGHKVTVGYYDQGLESLPDDTTVLRAVWPEDDPSWVQQDVRDLLGRFGLSGDLAFQPVGQLSGGEKGKAALARLAATGANLLVMDEPTNHLDIWSCDALERSIREFEGTVLVVSHDRYFLNQVADRLVVVDERPGPGRRGGLRDLPAARSSRRPRPRPRRSGPGPIARPPSKEKARRPARRRPRRREEEAEVPLPQGGRPRAGDRRGRGRGRRAGARPRPARDLEGRRPRPGRSRSATTSWPSRSRSLYEHWEEALEL